MNDHQLIHQSFFECLIVNKEYTKMMEILKGLRAHLMFTKNV
uniref:Uncharacterized protein n=1 Tax=Meloidogyne enterolobii TaxID=390850 RepID=A0A6V7VSC4_MELEN|nr:unnamed protein product [Meloidogyne enterolobii]